MSSTLIISLCFIGFFCFSNGNAAAFVKLTAEEQAIVGKTLSKTINASVEEIGNALIKVAENGSEAIKKSIDNQIKLMHYPAVIIKGVAEVESANLTDKTKQYFMDVVNIMVDEKLSNGERTQKISVLKKDAEAEKEMENNRVNNPRIRAMKAARTQFWGMDFDIDGHVGLDELRSVLLNDLGTKSVVELFSLKNVFKLAKNADTNGDGKLSPYEFSGLFDF